MKETGKAKGFFLLTYLWYLDMLTQFIFAADLNKGLNDQQQGQTTSAWILQRPLLTSTEKVQETGLEIIILRWKD